MTVLEQMTDSAGQFGKTAVVNGVTLSNCRLVPLVLAISWLVAGCALLFASPPPADLPGQPQDTWRLVVIGDSSLWGLGVAYAAQIEKDVGVKVTLYDITPGGLSAGEVLQALQTGKSPNLRLERLPQALREADVVVMFVNPEDSIDPAKPLDLDGCLQFEAPKACGPESFERYTADVKAIWAKTIALRGGRPVILRATDIYNPLVRRWQEQNVFNACTVCWENMSNAAHLAADAHGIPFLSLYDAFNGPQHDEDPVQKGYIADDGEHPSALASQHSAELLARMGYAPVSAP